MRTKFTLPQQNTKFRLVDCLWIYFIMVAMTEKLDLPVIGKLYGYTPPDMGPSLDLQLDWSSVTKKIETALGMVTKKEGGLLSLPIESSLGDLKLKLNFIHPSRKKSSLLGHLVGPDMLLAGYIFHGLEGSEWTNVHRIVAPPFRRQGITSAFFRFADLYAQLRANEDQRVIEVRADTYQLDVVATFASAGFTVVQADDLRRICEGDRAFSLTGDDEHEAPWTLKKGKRSVRLDLFKVISPVV